MDEKVKKSSRGLAALPVIIVLTALIIMVSILVGSISLSDSLASHGRLQSEQALVFAQAAARDALERVTRNKNYSGSYDLPLVGGGCNVPYDACATAMIDSGTDPKIVQAQGRVGDFIRKIKVNIYLDAAGLITRYDWLEF